MSITAKPTSYTVNTAHAKCPDHLWMIDEGSDVYLYDKGKSATKLNMTLTNGDMWGTDGTLSSPIITCVSATNRYARRVGYTPPSASALWIAIGKSSSGTIGTANEALVGIAKSDGTSSAYGYIAYTATTGYPTTFYDYGTQGSGNVTNSTDVYDGTTWHMIAGMVRGTGSSVPIKKLSVDGAAWDVSSSYAATWPNDGGGVAPNAIGIGCRPAQTPNAIFNGSILAVMVWDDFDWTTASDSWIAALYADPWQFLTTSVKKVKVLAPAAAASASSIEGVVLNAGRDTVIGEFTGQAFEADLESGEAVLKIAVADITPDGSTLTTSDTPLVIAYNTNYSTDLAAATVIEE
jgi:hypothetical protein